jgi:hypothetical protein
MRERARARATTPTLCNVADGARAAWCSHNGFESTKFAKRVSSSEELLRAFDLEKVLCVEQVASNELK